MHFGTHSTPEYDKTVHGEKETELNHLRRNQFSHRPSVAANFCCKEMHNRKDIGFEEEGDKLLSLTYSHLQSPHTPFCVTLSTMFDDVFSIFKIELSKSGK